METEEEKSSLPPPAALQIARLCRRFGQHATQRYSSTAAPSFEFDTVSHLCLPQPPHRMNFFFFFFFAFFVSTASAFTSALTSPRWLVKPLSGHRLKEEAVDKAFEDDEVLNQTEGASPIMVATKNTHPHNLKSPSLSDAFEELFADEQQ